MRRAVWGRFGRLRLAELSFVVCPLPEWVHHHPIILWSVFLSTPPGVGLDVVRLSP